MRQQVYELGKRAGRFGAMVATLGVLAAPVQSETLGDALAGAYTHSGLLEQNRALLRATDEDVAVALAQLRPVIAWSATAQRTFSNSATNGINRNTVSQDVTLAITAQMTLYDFGRNRLAVEAAKEAVLAARFGLVSVEQSILQRAVEAFMEVRRAVENVGLRENNVRLITQELRAAQDRFDVGEVTRTDVALAEARLAAARANLASEQGSLAIARAEYAAVVGRKPGALRAPGKAPSVQSQDAANAIALRTHPNLKQAQHLISQAELNVVRADASMKPSVTLGGNLGVTQGLGQDGYTESGRITLEVGGPIYQGGGLSALKRQAIARRDAQRGSLHTVRHNVTQGVANSYAQLAIARARIQATDQQVRAARVAFDGVREEATLGARTTLDVLDAEQELLDAQTQFISAQVDETIAVYRILASMGLLTADYLKLGVPQYDPAAYYELVKTAPTEKSKQGKQLDRILKSLGKE